MMTIRRNSTASWVSSKFLRIPARSGVFLFSRKRLKRDLRIGPQDDVEERQEERGGEGQGQTGPEQRRHRHAR